MKIGIVYFGIPAIYNRTYAGDKDPEVLKELLLVNGFESVEFSITTAGDAERVIENFTSSGCGVLLICLHHWTRIALVTNLVRRLNLPTALYAKTTGGFNGTTALTAVSGSLKETSSSRFIDNHARFKEGMEQQLMQWLAGADALQELRRSRLLMWGGSYGADMPYTRSDADFFENVVIAEVMQEQEVILTDKVKLLIAGEDPRVKEYKEWLADTGVGIKYDNRMITDESLSKQIALLIAAEERLEELQEENIKGVSLKCHFELSICSFGCTGCLIPAFLPYGDGPRGKKRVYPVACEGDLNGLVSSTLIHQLNNDVPPLFGDFVEYNEDFVLMRNCGASSVFWSNPDKIDDGRLEGVDLLPNMHGKSGAAVHYETPAIDTITVCRIARIGGQFYLFAGIGRVLPEADTRQYSDSWPHTRIAFEADHDTLFEIFPCNHASATIGDYRDQLRTLCRMCGIQFVDIGREQDIMSF